METLTQIPQLLLNTIILRPYVFIFFAVYAVAATLDLGLKRMLSWTAIGYLLAFCCEFSSIHWGFPFGSYYYIETTRGHELWIFGVPFMDSLSFVFLSYISHRLALFFTCPVVVRKNGIYLAQTKKIRRAPATLLLTALLMTMIDLVVDPATLQGDKWFLGLIYGYPETGFYFGVPLANFAGWFFVGLIIPIGYLAFEAWL